MTETKRGAGVGTSARSADPDLLRQLGGFSLTTAEILYRLPDAQTILQSYVWQDYDVAPRFPKLTKFLTFWERELDGPLHSVQVTHAQLLRPLEIRSATELALH